MSDRGGSWLRSKLDALARRAGLPDLAARLADRAMDAVLDMSRVTNDGAWRSVKDTAARTAEEPPVPPGKRRGIPGG